MLGSLFPEEPVGVSLNRFHASRPTESCAGGFLHAERHESDGRNANARLRGRLVLLAEWTGLEPATPGVTGRYSNQLNYHS